MSDTTKLTALITGASSGIGYELAKLFARDGYDVVLVATREETLRSVAKELEERFHAGTRVIAKDLSRPEGPREIFEELNRDGVCVDILVNNAGFGGLGPFAETDLKYNLDMIAVNLTGLTELCGVFLPRMLEQKHGRILNVASTAAFQAGPLMSVYYATKAYVVSFSEALANEVRGTGVTVSVLCPGPTETNFQKRAGTERSPLFSAVMASAQSVAEAGYRGMMRGKILIVPGLLNKIHVFMVRFLPRRIISHLVRAVQQRRGTS
jgi:short-subunit dehydrogenase